MCHSQGLVSAHVARVCCYVLYVCAARHTRYTWGGDLVLCWEHPLVVALLEVADAAGGIGFLHDWSQQSDRGAAAATIVEASVNKLREVLQMLATRSPDACDTIPVCTRVLFMFHLVTIPHPNPSPILCDRYCHNCHALFPLCAVGPVCVSGGPPPTNPCYGTRSTYGEHLHVVRSTHM